MTAIEERRTTCARCDRPLPQRAPHAPGQPQKYCSASCRQAAHRSRYRRHQPDPDARRAALRVLAAEADGLHASAERVVTSASGELQVTRARQYSRLAATAFREAARMRDLAAAHDRAAGCSWHDIAHSLGVSPTRAQQIGAAGARLLADQSSTVEAP